MNDNMTQQEMLDYIVDKFNITMEFEKGQIQSVFETICTKAVTWELVTSILALICVITIVIVATLLIKHQNKKENIFKYVRNLWDRADVTTAEARKFSIYLVIMIVYIIGLIIVTPLAISEIVDIIQCIAFPEKVIIEFIGKYI